MDPNCIFCHMLWIALKPYEAAGLQVRWIPVGFLQKDSSAKAAAILTDGEPALEQCQQHFNVQTESGGIDGIAITPAMRAKLASNLQLMRLAGVEGTPGVFYKDAAGHVMRQDGMPSLSELPKITGLPPQPETDPQLARFSK
jgi:thiol:disulfide interchange protein DsbG